MLLIYCATPARLGQKRVEIMDLVSQHGYGPFHPFQAFEYERFEGGPVGRQKTMEFCCRAIDICDEFWLFGISIGTLTELCYVLDRNSTSINPKPIKLFQNKFDERWLEEYIKLKDNFGDPLSKISGG